MKIISTKEYNKLKKTQSAYLDLLMKPLQGVFEKVTDDDLLRENGLLNAENERLNNIINEFDKLIEQYSKNDYYYKYNGKYLRSEIINDFKELKENNNVKD